MFTDTSFTHLQCGLTYKKKKIPIRAQNPMMQLRRQTNKSLLCVTVIQS